MLSENYRTLYRYSQQLLLLLQVHWREDRPVAFGVREVERLLNCDRRTAMKAFDELQKRGFIVKIDESLFNSRTESRSRTWRLTWLPYDWKSPTEEWEKWTNEN
ncbi:MAG: hypothetical protein DRR42_26805 [Gammaproteobacteria bacterium]|nr:MAG: hypothetical protein DRR42_26805 [Gammaproteobacteria bacterium]